MGKLVSIVMSVYNETDEELSLAIKSILAQTYNNFEFIIVMDNPNNSRLLKIIKKYAFLDSRIKIITNDTNIGLANSLNKAILASSGDYIARMDADDISLNNRIKTQVDFLLKNKDYDILSTNRIDIDEQGYRLKNNYRVLKHFDKIKKVLPYGSVITHPSVMMRRNLIFDLKGYRNFETGQDYDLWLRAITADFKIKILNEKLIYYRIRQNSITNSNPYKQYLHGKYARVLYKQRLKYGRDTYSDENKNVFLHKHGYFNETNKHKFNKGFKIMNDGVSTYKKKRYIQGVKQIVLGISKHKELKNAFINSIKFKLYSR